MMLIETYTGNEVFQDTNCKVHLFFTPSRDFPGEEKHVGILARSSHGGPVRAHGRAEWLDAVPGYREEFGKWNHGNYDVADGVVLKLFASCKTTAVGPRRHAMASMYIQPHPDAPLNRVTVNLSGNAKARFASVHTTGRFYILSAQEAEALGVTIAPAFRQQTSPENRSMVFRVEELEPQLAGREVPTINRVQNSAGEEVRVATRHRSRALDLG